MKLAAVASCLAGFLMTGNAAFAQAAPTDFKAQVDSCLQRLGHVAEPQRWKLRYCVCFAERPSTKRTIGQCMRDNDPEGARHPPGYEMLYCTETSKHSDRPDQYLVYKYKYFFPPAKPGEARVCTNAWEPDQCNSYAITDPQGSRKIEMGADVITLNPPYHRSVRTDGGETSTLEGPCEVFGEHEDAWPDRDSEPQGRAAELVCTQANGPSYCVPGRYADLTDPASIDKARIDREDMARSIRISTDFRACIGASRGQMPDATVSIYCSCLNSKMGGRGMLPTTLMEWARSNPAAGAECRKTAEDFVASHPAK